MKPRYDNHSETDLPTALTPPAVATEVGDDIAKRVTDLAISSVLLVAFLPVLTAIACAIRLESAGPVLYRGERIGRGAVPFGMLKFRKMNEHASGPRLTRRDDIRFTRIGRLLARTKLDELPQLLNVLRGEMSLVGPRPEDPAFVAEAGPRFLPVLRVRPGITGLSQVHFAREYEQLAGDDPVQTYVREILPRKIEMDSFYAEHRTWWLDLKILGWTGLALIKPLEVELPAHGTDVRVRRARPSGGSIVLSPHQGNGNG